MNARVGAAPTSLQTDGRWNAKVAFEPKKCAGNHLNLAMLRCGSVFASAPDTVRLPLAGIPQRCSRMKVPALLRASRPGSKPAFHRCQAWIIWGQISRLTGTSA